MFRLHFDQLKEIVVISDTWTVFGCDVSDALFLHLYTCTAFISHSLTKLNIRLKIMVFWAVTSCSFVGFYERFKETYTSTLKMEAICSSESLIYHLQEYTVPQSGTSECELSPPWRPHHILSTNILLRMWIVRFSVLVAARHIFWREPWQRHGNQDPAVGLWALRENVSITFIWWGNPLVSFFPLYWPWLPGVRAVRRSAYITEILKRGGTRILYLDTGNIKAGHWTLFWATSHPSPLSFTVFQVDVL
jgi:hypothetical protein